jgi:hypothetical protein
MALTKVSYSMIQGAPVNVLDFGADPTGVVNSATAIQAAITAAGDGGGVFIPAGTYKTDSTINISNCNVFGVGSSTILKPSSAVSICILMDGTTNAVTGFPFQTQLHDLFIEGENTSGATGILVGQTVTTGNYHLNNITVNRFAGSGAFGVKIAESVFCKLENSELARCQVNLYVKGTGSNPTTTVIENCYIRAADAQGGFVQGAWQITFRNCVFEANRSAGLRIAPLAGFNAIQACIEDCWFEDNQINASPRTSSYAFELDGTEAGATLTCDLRNIFFGITASTEKAIYAAKLYSSSWANIENRNIANSIAISGMSVNDIVVTSAPTNFDWLATINLISGSNVTYLPTPFDAWKSWVPTITGFGSMIISSVIIEKARYKVIGKTCTIVLNFTCTTSVSASRAFNVSLPSGVQTLDTKQFSAALATDTNVDELGYVQSGNVDGIYIGKPVNNYSLGAGNGAKCSFTFEIV